MTITLTKKVKNTITTKTNGNFENIKMSINMDAFNHIMNRLTDMYTNKQQSIVRELVSNAIDAVINNNKDKIVKITAPTILDPNLIVEDNGVGMSYDDILEIYSKYGASTKYEDLTQIGSYGLGAKVPLAYTNSFTIETIKNNKLLQCVVYKEENNIPTIKIISNKDTELQNGTKIIVPVLNEDVEIFTQYVRDYENNKCQLAKNDITIITNIEATDELVFLDTLNISEDIRLNLYVYNSILESILFETKEKDDRFDLIATSKYILQGYIYTKDVYSSRGNFVVELVPGLVDFISSREHIDLTEKTKTALGEITLKLTEWLENNFK